MKILFAFENPLPSAEADAEVFITTARYLRAHLQESWLHVPAAWQNMAAAEALAEMPVIPAFAPLKPAALRHFLCGLTIGLRREFHQADLVYTRNLFVAWMAILYGQRVVFDHYRPWPDQIPPLQRWLYKLFSHKRFLGNICHSDYTLRKYLALGVPPEKLRCIHNGFEPKRFAAPIPLAEAKARIGVAEDTKTVVYTGRVNHKKGLELVIEAAKQLPQLTFLFVGSYGEGPVEALARAVPNVQIVPWQTEATLGNYISAADVLLVPPSFQPLAKFGSTVLPLKLFLYLGSGRPILAGNTPDVAEVLKHDENAFLCAPDDVAALVAGLRALTEDDALAARLAAGAAADSRSYSWAARAETIFATLQGWLADAPFPGQWGAAQQAAWKDGSRRWWGHFIRTRGLVLPPGP
ncbi:MAG: glycosyltransferase [Rhodospirillales bacterium]|nr:glycosyltransferase [Rhodospirillales bacterium]